MSTFLLVPEFLLLFLVSPVLGCTRIGPFYPPGRTVPELTSLLTVLLTRYYVMCVLCVDWCVGVLSHVCFSKFDHFFDSTLPRK